jgi:hypothetical protein
MCETSRVKYEGEIKDRSVFVKKLVKPPSSAWPKRQKAEETAVGAFPVLNPEPAKAG